MPPLNTLNKQVKPQHLEMDNDYLRENLSQQELVQNGRTLSDNVVVVPASENRVSKRQIITVAILCFVNLINYMDRYTVAGLLVDIAKDFDLTESQQGALQTVFILVYMVMAPLYGYLGDRFNRKILMAVGVFIWSLTTLLGSFMKNYTGFLIMRGFVGLGEASYSTIAPTIISDLFVSNMRSKMLALFYFAIPVGSGLGYIVGAEVADIAQHILPDEKDPHAWRWGLRMTPVLGLIAVVLILFVLQEPPRGECDGAQHLKPTSFTSDLKHLFCNRSFILTTLGFTCVTYVAGALAWWGPKYVELGVAVQDNPNVQQGNVSFIFGVIAMVAGLIGVPLGSFAGQRLRTRYSYADPVVCGSGLVISMPLLVGGVLLAALNTWGAFFVVLIGQIFLNLNWAVVSDMVLYVVIPTRRSSAEAFQILISHTFGDAGSPYVVGLVAEAFKPFINDSLVLDPVTTTLDPVSMMADVPYNSTIVGDSLPSPFKAMSDSEDYVEFKALQYSLVICVVVEALGAAFFFWSAFYITKDKLSVDRIIAGDSMDEGEVTLKGSLNAYDMKIICNEDSNCVISTSTPISVISSASNDCKCHSITL